MKTFSWSVFAFRGKQFNYQLCYKTPGQPQNMKLLTQTVHFFGHKVSTFADILIELTHLATDPLEYWNFLNEINILFHDIYTKFSLQFFLTCIKQFLVFLLDFFFDSNYFKFFSFFEVETNFRKSLLLIWI